MGVSEVFLPRTSGVGGVVPSVVVTPVTSSIVQPTEAVALRLLRGLERNFKPATIHMIAKEVVRQVGLKKDDAMKTMDSAFLFLAAKSIYHVLEMQDYEGEAITGIAQSLVKLTNSDGNNKVS